MSELLVRLQHKPLVGDGAMGTLLYGRGISFSQCLEALVIERPDLISGTHREYAQAGADLLTTHTFGANRMRLAHFGREDQVRALNMAGVSLAQEVRATVGADLLIAGNVGPVGQRVAWDEPDMRVVVEETLREQIGVLAEAGIDLLLFETFSDVTELEMAVRIAKDMSTLPVIASMSYGLDGLTLAGDGVATATARLVDVGAEVIGANCSVGPAPMVATLQAMRAAAPAGLLSVTPNAGLPVTGEDGRLQYPVDAAGFANYVPVFLANGAAIIGGCCGTTPEHIAAVRCAVDAHAA